MTERYHSLDTDSTDSSGEEVPAQPEIIDSGATPLDKTSPEEKEWTSRLLRIWERPGEGTYRVKNPNDHS